jgi:molybdopterin-containing oxidoreductase family iron-sulfur binding subunit
MHNGGSEPEVSAGGNGRIIDELAAERSLFELPVVVAGAPDAAAEIVPSRLDPENVAIDLGAIREQLAHKRGPQYWKSFEELAETEEFQDYLKHEFPAGADEMTDPVTRRGFLKVMGASFALAGLGACVKQPEEKIVPYVKAPEQFVPGRPLFFATATQHGGQAMGVLVESHMGRPTKVEGNPDHPASLGATDIFAQASILTMYDPDRSQTTLHRGEIASWDTFTAALSEHMKSGGGAGLRILTERIISPTLAAQMRDLLAANPTARWHQYEPVGGDTSRNGLRAALGRYAQPVYHFDKADVIVSLDADFLMTMPGNVRYAREFIDRRRVSEGKADINRLYVAESCYTNTGAMADNRMAMRAGDIEAVARAIAGAVGVAAAGATGAAAGESQKWVAAVAADLGAAARKGRSLVIAGETQPEVVHQIAHAINQALGNVGSTITYADPVEESPVDHAASLAELVRDMKAGAVTTLVVLGGNPVYNAPVDLGFAQAYADEKKVPFRVHLSMYVDETSELSHWHIPESHYLEIWSDLRAYDGTTSIIQPLIAPLYQSRSHHELVAALAGTSGKNGYDIVRAHWQGTGIGSNFEEAWQRALHDGVVRIAPGTAAGQRGAAAPAPNTGADSTGQRTTSAIPPVPIAGADSSAQAPRTTPGGSTSAPAAIPPQTAQPAGGGLEIVFRPDPHIWDGRYANNGWLQELPKPMTKLTWDNAALIAPKTAEELDLENEDYVELHYRNNVVKAPIWIVPGHPVGSVTVNLGYGRSLAGRVGSGIGFNAYTLRTSDAPWFGRGLEIVKTGEKYPLATTQDHSSMEGRDLVRSGTVEEYRKNQALFEEHHAAGHASMLDDYVYNGHAWGMAIDLNACIGCNACTIACQAENNIAVVGKEQVKIGREMHWIRVDRYFTGEIDAPGTVFQPVPCMHCEKAPCEVVCPVGATVHSAEGLNDMVYNRCIGTRYCSNNCPYKVRRYNFLKYVDYDSPSLKMMRNPDVTIRSRGVMEKCTYCVQRINSARIEAKKENRRVRDGEIETACQAVCPTEAIVFGDINDKTSQVAKMKADERSYGLLTELNTQPRTTYMGRVTNPNPALVVASASTPGTSH